MSNSDVNFRKFLISISIIGFLIFVGVFILVFRLSNTKKIEVKDEEINLEDLTQKEMLAVVLSINSQKNKIELYDLVNNKVVEDMKIVTSTKYSDANGTLLSGSEITPGDVVNLVYTDKSFIIARLSKSEKGWSKKNVLNAKLDSLENKIVVDKKIYKFTEDMVVYYKGEKVGIDEITDKVVLTLKGYDSMVWAIDIEQYLGAVRIVYPDFLEGADVEIDSDKIVKIQEVEGVFLTPGEHDFVVRKSEIDPIKFKATIAEKEMFDIDLGEVTTKKSSVTFKMNVTDYYIDIVKEDSTINSTYTDDLTDTTSAVKIFYNQTELPYGTYEMTFRKKGFKTKKSKITISTATKVINVNFESDGTTIKTVLETSPTGADVYVNGKYVGEGPITTYLYKGTNTIKVEKNGYKTVERTLNIEEEKEYTFNLVQENIYGTGDVTTSDDIYQRKN